MDSGQIWKETPIDIKYRLVVLAFFLVIGPTRALGLPATSEPLWPLTAKAELIIVAEIVDIELIDRDELWNEAIAHLKVLETLKGPEFDNVDVPFPVTLAHPGPPQYLEDETVLVFLKREGKLWETVGLSYGTLYPQGPDLEDMRTMIGAALAVQGRTLSEEALEDQKREWLVQAAALPGTRWHGLYELMGAAEAIRISRDGSGGRPSFYRLGQHDRELLAEALVQAPKLDPSLAMMLEFLRDYEDPRIDRLALSALEGILALERPPRWVRVLVWVVLERFGDTGLEARLKGYGVRKHMINPDQLRSLWSDAKSELGLPDVSPTEIDLEDFFPVGGLWPDY